MEPRPKRSPRSAVVLGGGSTVASVLPMYFTGAMAVQLTGDLRFGVAGIGLAVAMFRASSALASVPFGRLVDRIGALRSLRLAAAVTFGASIGIAVFARGLASLVVLMMLAGLGSSLSQPAANRLLVNLVLPGRLGTAFGLKQSAPPIAAFVSGLGVPLLALTLGWQSAYLFAALTAGLVAIGVGRPPTPRSRTDQPVGRRAAPLPHRRALVGFALAFGCGTAASSVVSTFFVASVSAAGMGSGTAGVWLAVASVVAMTVRLVSGAVSDRRADGHLAMCAAMLVVGALGIALLATGRPGVMALGMLLALPGTWGFNGVFWFAMLRSSRDAPGRVTGVLAPGALIGGILGPMVLGVLIDRTSYTVAWWSAAGMAVVAAIVMLVGNGRLASRDVA